MIIFRFIYLYWQNAFLSIYLWLNHTFHFHHQFNTSGCWVQTAETSRIPVSLFLVYTVKVPSAHTNVNGVVLRKISLKLGSPVPLIRCGGWTISSSSEDNGSILMYRLDSTSFPFASTSTMSVPTLRKEHFKRLTCSSRLISFLVSPGLRCEPTWLLLKSVKTKKMLPQFKLRFHGWYHV